jgi:tetratricopeptide (TPR) repeat protein
MKFRSAGRIAAIALITMLAIGRSAEPTAAQKTNFAAIQSRIHELFAGGDYAAALIEARKLEAAVRAELGTSSIDYGVALSELGQVYQAQSKYAEAEGAFERALIILERALQQSNSGLAVTLNDLATVYVLRGRYADAERLLKRALAINEQALGPKHPNVASVLENLATVYLKQGNQPEAMKLIERAREIELGTAAR